MRGSNVVDPNNGSVATPVGEVEKDGDDSKNAKDMKDAPSADLISINPTKDPSSTEVNAPPFIIDDVPPPSSVNNDAPQGDETVVNNV